MSVSVKVRGQWVQLDTCPETGKVMHETRDECMDQVRFFTSGRVRRRGGQGKTRRHATAYRCEHCNGWHVGTGGKAR